MAYISKKQREKIKQKFGGRCAYSGTLLEDDWQIDHLIPIRRNPDKSLQSTDLNCEENLIPTQKLINHYKHSLNLDTFRNWYLKELHNKLAKLPKNPRTEKSKRKIKYLNKIASYFEITPTKPFSGIFYFEKKHDKSHCLEQK